MALSLAGIVAYVVLCVFILCAFIPALVIAIIRFKQDWDDIYFVKRRRLLVILLFVLNAINGFFHFGLDLGLDFNLIHISTYKSILTFISSPILLNLVGLTVARIWLLYYDMEIQRFQQNKQWRMAIDPNEIESQNWFISHINTFGNQILFILFVFGVSLVVLVLSIVCDYLIVLQFITLGSYCMTMVFIWNFRLRSFAYYDSLGIKRELLYICFYGFLCFLFALILEIIIGTPEKGTGILWAYYDIATAFGIIYILVFVSKKLSLPKRMDLNQRKLSEITISHWSHIIVTSVGYQSFMKHLEKEICSENMLFITEYIQIKNVLKIEIHDLMQDILSKHLQLFKLDIELPNDAPQSLIGKKMHDELVLQNSLYNDSNKNNGNGYDSDIDSGDSQLELLSHQVDIIKSAFVLLYNKYIDPRRALFMINLSYPVRHRLTALFAIDNYNYYNGVSKRNSSIKGIHNNNSNNNRRGNNNNNNTSNNNNFNSNQLFVPNVGSIKINLGNDNNNSNGESRKEIGDNGSDNVQAMAIATLATQMAGSSSGTSETYGMDESMSGQGQAQGNKRNSKNRSGLSLKRGSKNRLSQLGKFARASLIQLNIGDSNNNNTTNNNNQLSKARSISSVDVFQNSVASMLVATETAAVEISMLLRQSFARFKDSEEEFNQVSQLAIEHLQLNNNSNHV